ncbi:MAG: SlyX family protein [Opitutus sp.]
MSESVTRLEEKIAYLERHVVDQDKAMLEFAEELERLRRELKVVSLRLNSGVSSGSDATEADEPRPPHY